MKIRSGLILLFVAAPVIGAQRLGNHVKGELGASLYFGATQQRLAALAGELSRVDSALAVTTVAGYRYGESADADGVRAVLARSWSVITTADLRPYAVLSPFFFGGIESSYEQRLAQRLSGGAGVRWMFLRTAESRASLSGALLAEHVRALPDAAANVARRDGPTARWSFRAKFDRVSPSRVSIAHVTFYQPAVTSAGRYRLTSSTRASYALSRLVSATFTVADTYDSEARTRGARSNNDGMLLFGLMADR